MNIIKYFLFIILLKSILMLSPALSAQYFKFEPNNQRLTISTSTMELSIEGGAIVYVKHKNSDKIFGSTNPWDYLTEVLNGFSHNNFLFGWLHEWRNGSYNKNKAYLEAAAYRRPGPSSMATFNQVSPRKGYLSHTKLLNDSLGKDQLVYEVSVDEDAGEVILQAIAIGQRAGEKLIAVDIPILKIVAPSVILGSGAKYTRADVAQVDQPVYHALGLHSPVMAVVEGNKSVLAVWSETTAFAVENIFLVHKPGYDNLILHTEQDPKNSNTQKIVSSPWRFGTYGHWTDAARRWRSKFEERTGAKPLWQNRSEWVRKIHAVYSKYLGTNHRKYAELASTLPIENLLFFLWNGDRIVNFGDHTLVKGIFLPEKEAVSIIKRYGWRLLLYHPYNLYYSKQGAAKRLEMLNDKGWLQAGYRFNPDYVGSSSNWFEYWSDVTAPYDAELNMIHPGSAKFQDYLVRNYRNWCATHGADGSYFDILGAGLEGHYPATRKVIDGEDVFTGERKAIGRLNHELPNLPVMSEYQSSWVLPHIFYSWEGDNHITQNKHAKTRLNHPLKVALTGSYAWLQEGEHTDPLSAALLGTLPEVLLDGDAEKEKVAWHQARARLFCEEELFNDLPPMWDQAALAYYRSKNGHWLKFAKLSPGSYGYVEEIPEGKERIRLYCGQGHRSETALALQPKLHSFGLSPNNQ